MENKYKLKIVHFEGLGTVTKRRAFARNMQAISTEFDKHHTKWTCSIFIYTDSTDYCFFFPPIVPFKTQRKLALCS